MLQGGSRFYLRPHTHIQITNNHAKRGGGIYVEDQNAATTIPCFFQIVNLQYPFLQIDSMITLKNNTAQEAGSAVYGGRIDQCYLLTSTQQFIYNSTAFTKIFNIVNTSSPVSQVSSNPVAVHVCKHKNISGSKIHEDQVYPGQILKIPVVLYGQRDGSVPGIVCSEMVNKSRGANFAPLQETQQTEYSCTNLMYTIFSTGYYEFILLRVDDVQYYEEKTRVLVNVTLLPCPPGFQLSNLSAQCECHPLLKERGLSCNISGATPLVRRTKSVWISIHPRRNDTILHDNCPLDYCKPTPLWLQLEHPDEQCAYEHSGLLCGRCKSNLSLAIGTSQCLECTNIHLTLLPFALAGLMLVLFLIVCNLTVSLGTINGLIFYANIVRVNHAFFFRTQTAALEVSQQVLAVFIAWLNLDLEIETCFFNGMDAYIQTWLQFAFLHMDDSWSHHLLEQALHHHCQVGGFQCSLSARYTVSSILYQTATYCHYCLLIYISAELPRGWQATSSVAVRWECPFSPRKALTFVPNGPDCHSVLHPSIHPATPVWPLHTILQLLFIQEIEDETLATSGFLPSTIQGQISILDCSDAGCLQYPTCRVWFEHSW